jgi:uncharacterized Zn-binding protein involved in type VI secretion
MVVDMAATIAGGMTHEYVIATGGLILGADPTAGASATAIAWAADRVLAVGSDEVVRAISRGDSTFIDLDGCAVTRHGYERGLEPLEPGPLEPGSPADLAFWAGDPPRIVATVRAGAFTDGDPHTGPFGRALAGGTDTS